MWLSDMIWRICTPNEPPYDKTNKMTCVPSEDSDQPGHPPSLIGVFAVHMKKHWALNYLLSTQWRLNRLGGWPGWSESSLGTHFVGFVVRRLKYENCSSYGLREWTQLLGWMLGWTLIDGQTDGKLWLLYCAMLKQAREKTIYEPSHEIMVYFIHRKLIFQTYMCSHPVGLDV